MDLTDLYQTGESLLRQKDIGFLLDAVETGYVLHHDRKISDRYTFKGRLYIDAPASLRLVRYWGSPSPAPVAMSAMTMPIPAIVEDGLMETALGLKASEV